MYKAAFVCQASSGTAQAPFSAHMMGDVDELSTGEPNADGKKPADHMSNTFFDRIARGNNLTKMGNHSNPRDVAMLIAAQARAPVDCPTLQAIGPQAANQAMKAIAIARTFLKESQSIDGALDLDPTRNPHKCCPSCLAHVYAALQSASSRNSSSSKTATLACFCRSAKRPGAPEAARTRRSLSRQRVVRRPRFWQVPSLRLRVRAAAW